MPRPHPSWPTVRGPTYSSISHAPQECRRASSATDCARFRSRPSGRRAVFRHHRADVHRTRLQAQRRITPAKRDSVHHSIHLFKFFFNFFLQSGQATRSSCILRFRSRQLSPIATAPTHELQTSVSKPVGLFFEKRVEDIPHLLVRQAMRPLHAIAAAPGPFEPLSA